MKVIVRILVTAMVVLAATAFLHLGAPQAQAPDAAPKNLKVLPKNMSRREVVDVMRMFSRSLGVRCDECHAASKDKPDELDYAADKKPEKEAARKMMRMVDSVNEQIGKMDIKDPIQVGCVTCHHGLKHPETLTAVMKKSVAEKGVDPAIDNYRKLRDRYYGTGAYDFSPASINDVASGLAESKQDFDGAIKLLQLNLEFSPKDSNTYATLGRVQLAKGDKPAAIASFEKALELDPNNRFAKMQLEQAKGGK